MDFPEFLGKHKENIDLMKYPKTKPVFVVAIEIFLIARLSKLLQIYQPCCYPVYLLAQVCSIN